MTAFESAWIFLKNSPVPNYAQPKTESSRTALGDRREEYDYNQREMGRGVHPLQHMMAGTPYGTAVRMPRPEVGSGESSFDSERINTGTSLFNPTPSWQDMGDSANMINALSRKTSPITPAVANTPPQPSAAMGVTGGQAGVQQQAPASVHRGNIYPQYY